MLLLEFELELFEESLLSLVFELEVELELELLILHPMAKTISKPNAIRQSCRESFLMGLSFERSMRKLRRLYRLGLCLSTI